MLIKLANAARLWPFGTMGQTGADRRIARKGVVRGFVLGCLMVMGLLATIGPSGVVAWSDNHRRLIERHQQIEQLMAERDQLRNRVALLDPRHVDPDLAGELLRAKLNVVHPDEMVMLLH